MRLKKRIAALGASLVLAVSMMSIGSSAYNTSEPWTARWINKPNIPSSQQTYTVLTILRTSGGATAYRNGYSNTVNGGSGVTHVNSINGTMAEITIPSNNQASCNPYYYYAGSDATFSVSAYTSSPNNTYNCWGNMVSK